jgi:hypothetical protein
MACFHLTQALEFHYKFISLRSCLHDGDLPFDHLDFPLVNHKF